MAMSTPFADRACTQYEQMGAVKGTCYHCGWSASAHVSDWVKAEADEPNQEKPREGLSLWWEGQVAIDIARTAPKVKEYGTRDLEAMGTALAQMRAIELTRPMASIYGCMYYALGKCVRAIASLERGEMPSEDTLFDLSIYSMMARSYQARGEL